MSAKDDFDEFIFESKLEDLKDTQDGIQQMSSWCLQNRSHHKKIVACWLNVLRKVRVEHRLTLFYLANDVIQYSKRKRYEFVESWATALQRATTMVRDDKVKSKILRIFSIWEQREIYNEEYLSDLSGLLNISPLKKSTTTNDADDFQSTTLITNIRNCVTLAEATDKSFKNMPKAPICDIENYKQQLKDRSHTEDVEKDIERYKAYVDIISKNLQAEIRSRKTVIEGLGTAVKFYSDQRGEVKVVVSAYKNFGSRIKLVKKKLEEMAPNLPSPMPSPDINAPSPERDADLQLPEDPLSINLFKNNMNGFSSYMDGKLPFDINDFKTEDATAASSSQPIEVISGRSDDESYSSGAEYYKPERITPYTNNPNISIPGLNPMPVPPVDSGYTSLARSAQQYGNILPPPNPPQFSNNLHHGPYNNTYSNYNTDNAYNPAMAGIGGGGVGGVGPPNIPNMQSYMPPPPIPPASIAGTPSNSTDDFSTSWDMNLSWSNNTNVSNTSYVQSILDTPISPPRFEREGRNINNTPLEYNEHDNSDLLATQDVDHRQLHIPPMNMVGSQLGLSKDKTRQLDIDHRNLISLTGSPGINDTDDKFRNQISSDVDYRSVLNNKIKTIDSSAGEQLHTMITAASPSNSIAKKINSPQKSNASSSSESQKEDGTGNNVRYDPTDMVIDMDMSDEEIEDFINDVNHDNEIALLPDDTDSVGGGLIIGDETENGTRAALLDTPDDYAQQNIWEQQQASGNYAEQGATQPWNTTQPWLGRGGANANSMLRAGIPPPPTPPFPMPTFQYPNAGQQNYDYNNHGGGSGGPASASGNGVNNWNNSPQNHYRVNFSRTPRGGPYFQRGPIRGAFRGKFRGNSWM